MIGGITSLAYEFTPTQEDILRNAGINFIESERNGEITNYRIHLGVTANAQNDGADALIIAREINNELLREIDTQLRPLIKDKATETNITQAQTIVDGVVSDFVKDENVTEDGTGLTVTQKNEYTYVVSGTITPTKTLIAIEVNTTLQ